MAMKDYEKSKFRFSETFNNSNGKTSGSGFIGVLMGLTSILGIIAGLIGFFFGLDGIIVVLDTSLQLGFLSAVLMGARKITSGFGKQQQFNPQMNKKDDNFKDLG